MRRSRGRAKRFFRRTWLEPKRQSAQNPSLRRAVDTKGGFLAVGEDGRALAAGDVSALSPPSFRREEECAKLEKNFPIPAQWDRGIYAPFAPLPQGRGRRFLSDNGIVRANSLQSFAQESICRLDPPSTRPWRIRAPIGGVVVFVFTALISLSIWMIPTARAWFSFIPSAPSWIIFWFSVCVFLSAFYYGVTTLSRKLGPALFSYATLRTIVIVLIMYFAGAFLLEALGVAPKIENWRSVAFDVVRFFVIYTAALIFVLYLSQRDVRNAIGNSLIH